jgi:hypothetical protein
MTVNSDTDLTLPLIPDMARRSQDSVPLAAYVPIAIALIGVILVLIGGISVRAIESPSAATVPVFQVLPNVARDRDARHDLEFLDR